MNNQQKRKLTYYLPYLSLILVLASVPLYFFGYIKTTENADKKGTFDGITKVFQLSSITDEVISEQFKIIVFLLMLVLISSVIGAVISCFRVRSMMSIGTVFLFIGAICQMVVVILLSQNSGDAQTEQITTSAGYGSIVILVLLFFSVLMNIIANIIVYTFKRETASHRNNQSELTPYEVVKRPVQTVTPKVKFVSGQYADYELKIEPHQSIIIGRDPSECSVVMDRKYTRIGRKHCEIGYDNSSGKYLVKVYSLNSVETETGRKLMLGKPELIEAGTLIVLAKTDNIIKLG